MPFLDEDVARTRVAVRRVLAAVLAQVPAGETPLLLVACSGGADSLALAAATAFEAGAVRRRGGAVRAGAVLVDHGLQEGSAQVTQAAAALCEDLGLFPVEVVPVRVARDGGPEAAARRARYAAMDEVAVRLGAHAVLLGHTRDDQAEQVLLGLLRGSGARSLAGMPRRRGLYHRPFLDVARAATRAACRAQRLPYWEDPHNSDPAYARARARRLLAQIEEQLGPGTPAALARSAELLRRDADALDEYAERALRDVGPGPWTVADLLGFPDAVRTRLWRLLAVAAGCPGGDVSAVHVSRLDALLTHWHGQGPVHLPGGHLGVRHDGLLRIDRGVQ